jgi:SP family facilitated glucose transporter-like MFS transporter 1
MLLTLPFCEESPSYLFNTLGEKRAIDALSWFRPNGQDKIALIDREIEAIKEEQALSRNDATLLDIFQDPLLWRPLLVATMVSLSMQFSGIDAIFYYSTNVFHRAGVSEKHSQVYTTFISLANVLITIPAMLLMDVAGRKVIQTVGLSGMCASFIVMTIALVQEFHILSVVAMTASISFFALGPGCIAWFITSELMPSHARSTATTVALTVNWLANMFIAGIFPKIEHMLGNYAFATFAASTTFLAVFTVTCLPETKGKTITEVREWFLKQYCVREYSSFGDAQEPICHS